MTNKFRLYGILEGRALGEGRRGKERETSP